MRSWGRNYQTDENAYPPPSLLAKNPYAIHEEELNAQRDHRPQYRHVKEGNIWHTEAFDIAKTGSEPVVKVCTAKCRLQRFQKEYAVHYKNVSWRIRREMGEEFSYQIA
jgi:hypothetical protein